MKKKNKFYQVETEMVMFVFHHTYEMDHELFLHKFYFLILILLMINQMYHPKIKRRIQKKIKRIEKLIFTDIEKSSIPSITKSRLTDVKPHAKNSILNEIAKKQKDDCIRCTIDTPF